MTGVGVCSDGVSAPLDVQLTRQSATVLEVTWQAPAANHPIAGYRVYYHVSSSSAAPADLTDGRWEVKDVDGRLKVTELTGLKPHSQYTVRVRARGVDGRLGNFSEAAVLEDSTRNTGWLMRAVVIFCVCYFKNGSLLALELISYRYSFCCCSSSCWDDAVRKSLRLRRFKSVRDEIWQECSSSIMNIRHTFKMAVMTSFHAEK